MTPLRGLLLGLVLTLAAAGGARAAEPPAVTPADRVLGRADAPVTVIEYASFICPHCARWHLEVLPAFKARYVDSGQVRLVYRNLPTAPVELSATAAAVGICAAPDRFFDVADSLMHGQAAVRAGGSNLDWFRPAVDASGRTMAEIETCLNDPATLTTLQSEMDGAAQAGVEGTPSFFVNGVAVPNGELGTLASAIDPLVEAR